jgi:uncharacterized protein
MYYGKVNDRWGGLMLPLSLTLSLMLIACTGVGAKPPAPVTPAVTPTVNPSVTPSPAASPPAVTEQPQTLPLNRLATINQVKLKLALAETPMQQQIGLMYRTRLADDEGMLFPFQPARPVAFWMKNTRIALDMLYIRSGIVREIQANVPPCKADPCPSYPSKTLIDQVIEIRGGQAEKLGIKVGDRVTLTPIEN